MRLSKLVTLLLAGFLTFGSLNSVAATKNAKPNAKPASFVKEKAKKPSKKATPASPKKDGHKHTAYNQSGVASYYADEFNGRRTASGEKFNNSELTAAHKTLPFGTLVEVKNVNNGRSVVVRVNDRGPYSHARVIDVSKSAARQLNMHGAGKANVTLTVLSKEGVADSVDNDDI